ncbi:MAG: response regulator [Deltaproteobacteria bacterium]|nr:response regulator [Deltaproteobacteria bacterium]
MKSTNPLPIMVVDDDPGTRGTLFDILEDWHYQPIIFESGNEAIKAYAQNPVSVILADIQLPDMSGLEVLQTVREINPDVAVVIMSGHASLENAIQALNQGATAYLEKPLNMEELQALLKKAHREARLSQENKRLIDHLQLANQKLEKIARELDTKNRDLAHLTAEMEQLLHIVSHDLKSPLINIQGFTHRLEEEFCLLRDSLKSLRIEETSGTAGAAPAEVMARFEKRGEQSFAFIKKGVDKMDQMIQSLLRLSKIGRQADPFEEKDFNVLLGDIRGVFSHQLEQEKIDFVCHPLPHLHCRANEISQVFSNLIANAINYMGEKFPKAIEVRCVSTNGAFQFSVADTGIGIEEKDFEKIFKIFSRLGEKPVKGEGLGLTIVRKIIHGHGGRIWVQSKKGQGSTFYFTLPKESHGTTQAN